MDLKEVFKKREKYLVMNHPEGWKYRLEEWKILFLILKDEKNKEEKKGGKK